MEVDAIVTEVEGIIQDATYDETWIIKKFNEVLLLVATLCRIPGLQKSEVVPILAGESTALIPKTYLHDLFLVTTPTYPNGILIAPNIRALIENSSPTEQGPVQAVCLDGKILTLRPIAQDAEDLTCHFYSKPKELSAGDLFPDYIPETLHKELFQNYALKEAYLLIEDGIDGVMLNTQKYAGLAASAVSTLVSFYPNAPKANPEIRRNLVWF